MKAAVATRYGSADVVQVHATTVNRTDCGFRAAHPWFIRGFTGITKPKRTILGNEFAGVVDVVGGDVNRFAAGDRVFGYDDTRFGGHAEYLAIGRDAAVTTMTAGRDFATMTTDFTADNQRYDFVFDAVGKCSFRQCRELLKPRGIWTSTDLGPHSQNPLLMLANRFSRRRVIFPIPKIDRAVVDSLKSLVESDKFTPVVDRTYTLDNIVDAYRYVETQQKVGNVVITVASGGVEER